MGCEQSTSSAGNPQDNGMEEEKKLTKTPSSLSSSTSSSKRSPNNLKRSNSSPYRINVEAATASKRILAARAKLQRSRSSSTNWTLDRKDKIRSLGRAAKMKGIKKNSRTSSSTSSSMNPEQLATTSLQLSPSVSADDFIMDTYAIGKGSFGFVRLAKHKRNSVTYALKQVRCES